MFSGFLESSGRGNYNGGYRGGNRGGRQQWNNNYQRGGQQQQGYGRPPSDLACHFCNEQGHFIRSCPAFLAAKELQLAKEKQSR